MSQKILDADNHAKLQAIASTEACAEGRVITLDFSAIEQRFGCRWPNRREDVWPKLETIIESHAGRGCLWLRVQECEYLICVVDQPAAAAQALGFRAMEEALTHFMGRFQPKDVLVNRVTSIEGETVNRIAIEPGAAPPVTQAPRESKSFAPELQALASPCLVSESATTLILSCGLQDIVNLQTGATIGLRIGRYISEQNGRHLSLSERAALSAHALLNIDRRIAQSLPALFNDRAPKTLVAPFSLHTFGTSRGRTDIIDQLNRLDADQRSRLIIELGNFEVGTPSSRLMEAAAVLKPYCRHLAAQPEPTRTGVRQVINARFSTVAFNARELGGDDVRRASAILAFAEMAKAIAPRVIAADLSSEILLSVCSVAGVTLATISREGQCSQFKPDFEPVRPAARNHQLPSMTRACG